MYEGGPSSPACATARKPSSRARWNTSTNFDGGWPRSDESSPTAAIASRCGNACSSVRIASSALEVAQKTEDQQRRNAELAKAFIEAAPQARENGMECDPALGVRLRIEEEFGVYDALRVGLLQIHPR